MTITLTKKRIDEYTVYHVFESGTKHLPPVYAVKSGREYSIYELDSGKYIWHDAFLRTLKDVKKFIMDFDKNHEAELEKEAEEKAEEMKLWNARLKKLEDINAFWKQFRVVCC